MATPRVVRGFPKAEPAEERFFRYFECDPNSGCWLWTGGLTTHGYGRLAVHRRYIGAYRVSWEIHNGPIPPGLHVLHRCDTPACVNPAHLFLGTHTDNMADKQAKGRQSRGEDRPTAKLTERDVLAIRAEYAGGKISQAQLGAKYGVWQMTIGNVVNRKTWVHVGSNRRHGP